MTLTQAPEAASSSQLSSTRFATGESVRRACSSTSARTFSKSSSSQLSSSTSSVLQRAGNVPSRSSTYAMPPLMPAAKLRPVGPRTTTRPPVMYSQPWSPTPSTTASTPLLRTAKRSPARPRKKARPAVAPYSTVLPISTFSSATNVTLSGGRTDNTPPDSPLPTKSFASPVRENVTPGASHAPKLWPPEPSSFTLIVSPGNPSAP